LGERFVRVRRALGEGLPAQPGLRHIDELDCECRVVDLMRSSRWRRKWNACAPHLNRCW